MDKSQAYTRKPKPKLDQQTNFNMAAPEKERLHAFADRKDWSISQACRYLVMKALATEEEGE